MARLLVERETIYQDEVDMLMEGKSVSEIMKIMEEKDGKAKENPFLKVENVIKNEEQREEVQPTEEKVETTEEVKENTEETKE